VSELQQRFIDLSFLLRIAGHQVGFVLQDLPATASFLFALPVTSTSTSTAVADGNRPK
jgi:hypothetical protein